MTDRHIHEAQAASAVFIGIDVSKDTLDAYAAHSAVLGKWNKFANTDQGHSDLLSWARLRGAGAERRFCMEATGTYGSALALRLHEAGEHVAVVNPSAIKYSGPDGAANKTDKVDARKIADFARKESPAAWTPPPPEMRELAALVRYVDVLVAQQAEVKGRLQEPGLDPAVGASLELFLQTFAEQIDGFREKISALLDTHPDLRGSLELLDGIPGVAKATACRLLAEMASVESCPSAQSAAAYAGLSPKEFSSGKSVRRATRISKCGNRHLRAALYFPAIAALRIDDRFKAMAERMAAKGKCRMSIVCAAMRKLVMIAYGVLKSRKPYAKDYVEQGRKFAAQA